MTAAQIAETVTELTRAVTEYRQQNEQRTAGWEERLSQMDAAINGLQETLTRGTRLPLQGTLDTLTPAEREHKTAFLGYLRRGQDHGLRDYETRAMSVGSDPDGGYLVPADLTGQVVRRIYETSEVRAIAAVVTTVRTDYTGWTDVGEAGGGWTDETTAPVETTTPAVGSWTIPVHNMYAEPRVSANLLEDAGLDLEAWLVDKVADKLGRLEAAAFVAGNGVGRPRGFTTYTTAATADASRTWGQIEHVVSGANGAFAASNPSDKLLDLIFKLNKVYRPQARWVMARSLIAEVRKLKDGQGNYIWSAGLGVQQPQMLLGYPIAEAEDMPALATGSLSLFFGDFRAGYTVVDRTGIRVLRDALTAKPWLKLYMTRRVGGAVVDFNAIKALKFSA